MNYIMFLLVCEKWCVQELFAVFDSCNMRYPVYDTYTAIPYTHAPAPRARSRARDVTVFISAQVERYIEPYIES